MNKVNNEGHGMDAAVGRRRWLYAAVAAAAGLGGVGLAWWKHTPAPLDDAAAMRLWQMDFETPSGAALSMPSLKGRPLLLNFWATWCPPCVEELPLLDAFFKENATKGWQVLGMAVDKIGAVNDFMARQPLSFPIVLAGLDGVGLSKSLGNGGGGLPFTVVFGADGSVLDRKMGRVSPQDLARWHGLK